LIPTPIRHIINQNKATSEIEANTLKDVATWLAELGLGQYTDAFVENDIDLEVLSELTDQDLINIGVSLGHRKKILRATREFSSPQPEAAVRGDKHDQGERRHLTVLFADLAGSTKLSSELDPEDYRSVIRAYQEACAAVISHYDGFLAQYLGDGVLAYFGYPRAHEDDAERAVLAGKEVVAAISALTPQPDLHLEARVGIATGEVVVGETIGEGTSQVTTIAGETPNLAARLQALAPPEAVIISEATRQLVKNQFALDNLGAQSLKGFSAPMEAFIVGDATEAYARYEAESRQGSSQLVGREEEIGLCLRRWRLAKEGEGQVVLLSAEAGVGKSRVLRAIQDRVAEDSFSRLLYFGSPFHQNSALYPAAEQLRRMLHAGKQGNKESILDRLESALRNLNISASDYVPYLAALLGTDAAERYPRPDLDPEELRERTLKAITIIVEKMSEQEPVLMIVEDAHWIDPTTTELLTTLVNRARDKRILLIIAFRPEFEPPWGREGHVTTCALNHLSRKESARLVGNVAGGKRLPDDLINQIVSRTDGVPLFIEELTKSILESGDLHEAGDS